MASKSKMKRLRRKLEAQQLKAEIEARQAGAAGAQGVVAVVERAEALTAAQNRKTEEQTNVIPAEAGIQSREDAIAHEGGSLRELLQPGLRLAMLVGVVLAVLQQVTGINAILYYAPEIFKGAGAAASSAFNDTVWIGVFNLLFTIVAMMSIDRIGRKPLLLSGAVGMGVSLLLLARAFDARASGPGLLVVILAYVSFFAASLGPVVWVVMSEIFPTRIRGRAMSLATVSLWAACFLVSQTFPVLIDAAGGATAFRIYAAFCAVTALFVALAVPETRGKSLEEIERTWHRPLARH